MALVKINAKDGSPVEFNYTAPKQGGQKDVYFSPDRSYVVCFYRDPLDSTDESRIGKIVDLYRKNIFDQPGGNFWKDYFCWPEKIVEYDGMKGITAPAYQSHFFFGKSTSRAGAEKEGKWFAAPKVFNRFVPDEEKGTLLGYLQICLKLARAAGRLHAAGLAHSDLSYKNCLVDPVGGNACIIDIDTLVVPGVFPPQVLGTPDFIAPEVVTTQHLPFGDPQRNVPRIETDRHALSVLIYQYLFHRHPLRGPKVHSPDRDEQERLEMGEKALFIEHPTNKENRPQKFDANDNDRQPWINPAKLPYTLCGPHLKELFDKAFIDGLHDPMRRPTAAIWESALIKTLDMIQPCENTSCVKKWFVFDDTTQPRCPYCGTLYTKVLPILDFYAPHGGATNFRPANRRLMVWSGQSLSLWHADRNFAPGALLTDEQRKRVGYFQFHNGKWLFVNERLPAMKNITTKQPIPIGESVELTEGLQLHLSPTMTGHLVHVRIVNG